MLPGGPSLKARALKLLSQREHSRWELQRKLAREAGRAIVEGRDIGTVVLPSADVKIFLTASPEERAQRRYEELQQRGTPARYEDVLRDLRQRDENDRKVNVGIPPERSGLIFVFRTFGHIAYALVLQSEGSVEVNDFVRTP